MIANQLKYYENEDSEERLNKLVADNLALVKYIITRLEVNLPYGMDREDLVSIGNWGLIEAARNFNPAKNVKFQTYAYIKIRGAILDEVRKNSFGGQSIVRKQKQLMDVYNSLQRGLGRFPKDEEVAEALGITLEKLEKLLEETSGAYLVALDDFSEDNENVRILDKLSVEDDFLENIIENDRLIFLVGLIKKLPKSEQLVLSLYYEQELSLKEISLIMNLTESRISQIHKKAILYIRSCLD